jgi:competence protein ComEC
VLHKEIPFLRICLPLCGGIISGLYIKPDTLLLLTSALAAITGFSVSLFFNRSETNRIFGYPFSLSLFFCGLLLYSNQKNSISELEPEQTLLVCTLSDYPAEKTNCYLLMAKLNSKITDSSTHPLHGSILLYHRKDSLISKLLPGDRMIIRCSPSEISGRGNPCEFDYRFYMECQGFRYYAYTSFQSIVSYSSPEHRKLIHKALIIREKIIRMYMERGITGERLALLAAITLGQKNMLDTEQKNYFIKAGVMHIMAVSGLHTVILSLFVFNILFFLKGRLNIIRILLTLAVLWSFAFVTGLTPSVLRATLMFSFLQTGNLMKRPVNGINSVLASAFFLILARPSVIFDSGFLLSYSAVIYIIAFYRELYQKLVFRFYIADKIWQSAVIAIVAQAGTLPLTIALFNRFPTYFLLTNIVIVPLSSVLVIIGCLLPLVFPIKFLSQFLAMILNNLTGLTELLTRKASYLPLASIEGTGMTTMECLLLTCTIFLFTWFTLKRRSFSIRFPMSALIIFLLASGAREISTRVTNELIVYNTPGLSTIGIRTGKTLCLFSDTTIAGAVVARHCATLGLKMKLNRLGDTCICIRSGRTNILITSRMNLKIPENYTPDFVILTGSWPDACAFTDPCLNTKTTLIFSEGTPSARSSPGSKPVNSFPGYVVRKSGAFTRRI